MLFLDICPRFASLQCPNQIPHSQPEFLNVNPSRHFCQKCSLTQQNSEACYFKRERLQMHVGGVSQLDWKEAAL